MNVRRSARYTALLIGVWTVPFFIGAAGHFFGMAMSDETMQMPAWHIVVDSAATWYFWVPVTPVILWLGRRLRLTSPAARPLSIPGHLVASALVFVCQAVFVSRVGEWMGHRPRAMMIPHLGSDIGFYYLFSLATYSVILAAGTALDLAQRYRARDLRASQLEAQLAQARLRALRSQLQPHFLFNALNSIVMLMRTNAYADAIRLTLGFSDLMRYMLDDSDIQLVPLRSELDFLTRYLEIERVRLADRLTVEWHVAPDVLDLMVPSLVLQPIVENAIRHGIAPRPEGGWVSISALDWNGSLRLVVEDDGPGVGPEWNAEAASGVGLRNTRRRLRQLFGPDRCRLEVRSREGRGMVVTIDVPRQTDNDGSALDAELVTSSDSHTATRAPL